MNLYEVKCHISTIDCGDIERTIILNKYGTRNVIYHWTDLTLYKCYNHAFVAHNIYYTWGDIHYDYQLADYFIDEKINIGCLYKHEYINAVNDKKNITANIAGFKENKKTVSFFDTSFNDASNFTEVFFLDFLNIINEFCKLHKEINVLLKPKSDAPYQSFLTSESHSMFKKIWGELIEHDNFIYLDPLIWSAEKIIAISDVCVGMGTNACSTTALICGKDAVYFNNTGNLYFPFGKKYKNILVFEHKNLLIKQVDNILNKKFSCKDVFKEKEIRRYDAFPDNNAIERLISHLYAVTKV